MAKSGLKASHELVFFLNSNGFLETSEHCADKSLRVFLREAVMVVQDAL